MCLCVGVCAFEKLPNLQSPICDGASGFGASNSTIMLKSFMSRNSKHFLQMLLQFIPDMLEPRLVLNNRM